jgi:hypothetical protein
MCLHALTRFSTLLLSAARASPGAAVGFVRGEEERHSRAERPVRTLPSRAVERTAPTDDLFRARVLHCEAT